MDFLPPTSLKTGRVRLPVYVSPLDSCDYDEIEIDLELVMHIGMDRTLTTFVDYLSDDNEMVRCYPLASVMEVAEEFTTLRGLESGSETQD